MSAAKKKPKIPSNTIATNRKARRDYAVLDKLEAGIALMGSEVKSIRSGGMSLSEGYARVRDGEVFLEGVHIPEYSHAGGFPVDTRRPRKLLLHRKEIARLIGLTAQKGRTLVPLSLYWKNGKVKVELGICQGKQHEDRREDLKKRTAERESQRAVANSKRR